MADAIAVSGPVSGTDKALSFETGKLAPQSQGAVVARLGDTVILVTANADKKVREGVDFFPLTVDVEEKKYAGGFIPGSVFRREGRPTDEAVLTCRLIDRPLRPSFAEGYRNETQVIVTVLGVDFENPHDVLAINAASAALMISGIPFQGPIGAVRLAFGTDGQWIAHPTYEEGDDSTFEIVVAGRQAGDDVAIMMVEAGGTEKAWQYYEAGAPKVPEEVIADGLQQAKRWIQESIDLQLQLVEQAGVGEPIPYEPQVDYGPDVSARVAEVGTGPLTAASQIALKAERSEATDQATAEILAALANEFEGRAGEVKAAARGLVKQLVRKRIVEEGVRIDGRGPADLRPLSAEVGILPRAHGTGLFQRGETQVLTVATLGMPKMDLMIPFQDGLTPTERKRYIHHYTMPPFSNGETGRVGGTKRREVGHGLLAERAIVPVLPAQEDFPYAIRLVSEVLSSNGSTSMASVCGSALSLMDAGVPIKAPVAGIAMGLVFAEGRYTTLTDILGAEDAFGDMDFKVAGTAEFVTALQLDTKIAGLPADVLADALQQARKARLHILEVMAGAIAEPRPEVAASAPKIVSLQIPIDKIGEVIGPKGKVINALQQETGADINVDDDGMVGTVTIGGKDGAAVAEARRRIELILDPPSAEIGAVYTGRVVNVTKFGAFVNILPGRDGLVHISKLGRGKRVERVEDVVDLGDEISVRVDDIDQQGKVSLSPVGPDGESGPEPAPDRGPRRDPARPAGRSDAGRSDAGRSDAGSGGGGGVAVASFEAVWEEEAAKEFGDLGPPAVAGGPAAEPRGDRDRGPRRNPRRSGRR